MPTLEDQIARLADAAFERTEPVAFDPLVRRTTRRPWTSPVGLAAGVLLTAALAGLLGMAWFRDEPDAPAPAATIAPPPPFNGPTVTYPVDEEWLVPGVLPDGMKFDGAQRFAYEGKRLLSYRDPASDALVLVSENDVRDIEGPAGEAELGGRMWRYVVDDAAQSVRYTATVDGIRVSVVTYYLERAASDEVVGSLTWQQAEVLPRPPIDVGGVATVLVATGEQDGRPVELQVETDGVAFGFSIGSARGLMSLPPDEVLNLGQASGPLPSQIEGGRESESLVYGLARADVATVVVELTDGRSVSAPVQDLSGRFVENFYIVAVPTRTESGFELTEAIVALDADGNELFRAPYPPA